MGDRAHARGAPAARRQRGEASLPRRARLWSGRAWARHCHGGISERLPAPQAAFANGMLCHGLDFDDTHTDAVCHVSAVMAPAALAAAEARGASGAKLLAALVAGNEIAIRIGMGPPAGLSPPALPPPPVWRG